jgi:hypothetical protein
MTEQINYNLIDGEPVANRDCYYHHTERCTLISKGTYLKPCIPSSHTTCIPGLRLQRDHFKKTLEDFAEGVSIMATKREYDYLYKKALAWEDECMAAKKCLWAIVLEAAKLETNLREEPLDFDHIKSILSKHGFTGFYAEALEKLENES